MHKIESFENLHEALTETTILIDQLNYYKQADCSTNISKHNTHNKIGPKFKHQNHYTYKEIYSKITPKLKLISSPCTHFSNLAQKKPISQIGGGSRIVLQVKVLENNEGPSANGQANEGTQSQPSQPSTKLIQVNL